LTIETKKYADEKSKEISSAIIFLGLFLAQYSLCGNRSKGIAELHEKTGKQGKLIRR
jgi:hypothetical protein